MSNILQLDMFDKAKIRSLSKQRRRLRREKSEEKRCKQPSFSEQLQEINKRYSAERKKKNIADKIQTIKALQIIGADVSAEKEELKQLLT